MQPNQQPPTSLSSSHVLDIEVFQASQPSQVQLFMVSEVTAGVSDPGHFGTGRLTDPAPDPAIFVSHL
jgi:hypothetical protein